MRHDIIEYAEVSPVIGRTVTVTVDRPLGSYHPEHKDMYYPINYGYVEGIMAPDGEEQDAYILGVDEAIEKFTGKIIAIVHRNDDVEEKWVVAPEGMTFTKEEIREQIHFQEQYFDSEIDGKIFNDIMDVWLFEYDGEVDLGNATTDEVTQVAWMNREQIKELFDANMFVDTFEYFFTEVDK